MIKIKDSIKNLIENNTFFKFGIYYKLLNLTKVAHFIKPFIEKETKKSVSENAILMSLSRIQSETKKKIKESDFKIENIMIHSELSTATYYKTKETHFKINKAYLKILNQKGFITITEGSDEITIIFENKFSSIIKSEVNIKAKYQNNSIGSICIKFDPKYMKIPGLLYLILQQIALQNLNIIELNSTETEIIIYLENKDIKNAFETIYSRFVNPKNIFN